MVAVVFTQVSMLLLWYSNNNNKVLVQYCNNFFFWISEGTSPNLYVLKWRTFFMAGSPEVQQFWRKVIDLVQRWSLGAILNSDLNIKPLLIFQCSIIYSVNHQFQFHLEEFLYVPISPIFSLFFSTGVWFNI